MPSIGSATYGGITVDGLPPPSGLDPEPKNPYPNGCPTDKGKKKEPPNASGPSEKAYDWGKFYKGAKRAFVDSYINTVANAFTIGIYGMAKSGAEAYGVARNPAETWGGISSFVQNNPEEATGMAAYYALEAVIAGTVVGAESVVGRAGSLAFHHTTNTAVESIMKDGLWPGSYATPIGGLSPLQAHIELALNPLGGARNATLQINIAGLRAAGYNIPTITRVSSRFGMAGGGWEMQFQYAVPPEFIQVVKP